MTFQNTHTHTRYYLKLLSCYSQESSYGKDGNDKKQMLGQKTIKRNYIYEIEILNHFLFGGSSYLHKTISRLLKGYSELALNCIKITTNLDFIYSFTGTIKTNMLYARNRPNDVVVSGRSDEAMFSTTDSVTQWSFGLLRLNVISYHGVGWRHEW